MAVAALEVAVIGGLVGLLIGSFLNVVIFRMPKMLERQWAAECAEMAGKEAETTPAFNLVLQPRYRRNGTGLGYSPFDRHYLGNH